jgi:hypothetical protein
MLIIVHLKRMKAKKFDKIKRMNMVLILKCVKLYYVICKILRIVLLGYKQTLLLPLL